jgi:hypothetical protein
MSIALRQHWNLALVTCGCLLLAAAPGGCGSTNAEGPSTTGRQRPGPDSIVLTSSGLDRSGQIEEGIECQPDSIWLPLRWSRAPAGAAELVLYISRYRSETVKRPGSNQLSGVATLVSALLIGGIDPSSNELHVGALPDGAFTADIQGEVLCFPPDESEEFLFQLFALPPSERLDPSSLEPEAVLVAVSHALASGDLLAKFRP